MLSIAVYNISFFVFTEICLFQCMLYILLLLSWFTHFRCTYSYTCVYLHVYVYHIHKEGKKANWLYYILRKNCFLKYVIERNMKWKRRRGWRRIQLLNNFKEKRRQWISNEETRHHTVWKTDFGKGYESVVRKITWICVCVSIYIYIYIYIYI
jgi:hypothetical protein